MRARLGLTIAILLLPAVLAGQPTSADHDLLAAAEAGDLGALREALAAGADSDAADTAGTTALMLAVRGNHLDAVQVLAESGADLHAKNRAGDTALVFAARTDRLTVRWLVCRDAAGALQARDAAAEWGHAEVAALLDGAVRGSRPDAMECAAAEVDPLNAQAMRLFRAGQPLKAIPLAEEVLRMREAALGPDHADVATILHNLAAMRSETGAYAEAESLYVRALATYEAALGPEHVHVATSLDGLADLLTETGHYAEALPLYRRALAIREAAFGPNDPDVAMSLARLAGLLSTMDNHADARLLLERALTMYQATCCFDEAEAATLDNLAGVLLDIGDYAGARSRYERALALREAALSPNHPSVAWSLSGLGAVLEATGDFVGARSAYERALAISEAALGPNHPEVATRLSSLAGVLESLGDYAGALPLYRQALALREAAYDPDHPSVASSLGDIAVVLHGSKRYAEAEPLYERALAVFEVAMGPEHSSVATTLNNLAALRRATGDLDSARDLYERALAIREATLGPDHPEVAVVLSNLAKLIRMEGDPAAAEPLYERVLAIQEAAFGPDHPKVALALNHLAVTLRARGDEEAARPLFERSGRVLDAQLPIVLPTLSLAEQAAYLLDVSTSQTSVLLSSYRTPDLLQTAYPLVARWKGLLLHSLRTQMAVRALAADPALATEVEALDATRTDLAAWQDRAGTVPLADWQARRNALTAEKERLERTLAASLPDAAFTDPLRAADFPGVSAYLAPGEAFADAFRYEHRAQGAFVEHRYAVVLSAPGDAATLVDLGNADDLDAAIAAWHNAVTAGHVAEAERAVLAERLWTPLATALPQNTARLWLSPDGALARVPPTVLAEADPRTARLRLAHIASARALVRLRTSERIREDGVLLVGGLNFGTDSTGAVRPYASLPGTAAEIEALAALAARRDVTLLSGQAADPSTVRAALPEARYVHLATHGFFAAAEQDWVDTEADAGGGLVADGQRSGSLSGSRRAARPRLARVPLLESGLALAGANRGAGGQLTAEELTGLDLRGTELVVLSACDTGRGSEVTGQGVLGLQASFLAAGARTLLMSLWKVPDASTAVLMEAFYEGLWQEELRPAAALQRAQEAVRAAGYTAPVHWSGWVLIGEAW